MNYKNEIIAIVIGLEIKSYSLRYEYNVENDALAGNIGVLIKDSADDIIGSLSVGSDGLMNMNLKFSDIQIAIEITNAIQSSTNIICDGND